MIERRPSSRARLVRLALGLASGGAILVAVAWLSLAMPTRPALALGVIQVPSDKPALSPAQILARFPKAQHEEYMRRAIANARKAGVEYKTGGAFGAVIVDRDGNVLADGMNHVVAQNDPTWHGEMHAIRQACALLKAPKLDGCLLYTSSEPCPMCLSTALWARVDRLVHAADRHDAAVAGFDDRAFYDLFDKKPQADWPLEVAHLDLPDRTRPFDTWLATSDRVEY